MNFCTGKTNNCLRQFPGKVSMFTEFRHRLIIAPEMRDEDDRHTDNLYD